MANWQATIGDQNSRRLAFHLGEIFLVARGEERQDSVEFRAPGSERIPNRRAVVRYGYVAEWPLVPIRLRVYLEIAANRSRTSGSAKVPCQETVRR
jgi:hypothetical protein